MTELEDAEMLISFQSTRGKCVSVCLCVQCASSGQQVVLRCDQLSHLLCLLAALCSRRRSDWTIKELVSHRVASYLCQR